MMPGSDIETIANAGDLWRLVHLVQETIDKDGTPLLLDADTDSPHPPLAALRKLADELDPENGRF